MLGQQRHSLTSERDIHFLSACDTTGQKKRAAMTPELKPTRTITGKAMQSHGK